MMIRKAIISDIKTIHKLLGHYGDQGLLLARPISELYDHLRDFFVAVEEEGQEGGGVMGACAALAICWEDLAEVRSLAVTEGQKGKGLGAKLVETCLDEARALGLARVFALGFREVEKSQLPHKVWGGCLKCTKFPDCDENAMMIDL